VLEVDWTILFDHLDGSPSRLEIRVFSFYRIGIAVTIGAENAESGEVLDRLLEDFDFLRGLRLELILFYLRLNIHCLPYNL
jgi:hypothetical protein